LSLLIVATEENKSFINHNLSLFNDSYGTQQSSLASTSLFMFLCTSLFMFLCPNWQGFGFVNDRAGKNIQRNGTVNVVLNN
jgi:hypothetical protein